MTAQSESLPFLTSQERLQAYQLLINGCNHVWSKNKIQKDKAKEVLNALMPLTKKDPYFLAHLTSYVFNKSEAKDLKVFLSYAASLSSADGEPFSPGSKYKKPNLRPVGWAAIHKLDPKLAHRVAVVASDKWEIPQMYNLAKHFPPSLRTALKRYVEYRAKNPDSLKSLKSAGFANTIANMYRMLSIAPSDEAAQLLRWQQKDHKIDLSPAVKIFDGLTDLQIAEKIRKDKMPYLGILANLTAIGKKVSPVIAVAMLEQATGNQAVIMRATFEDAGILKDPEVKKLYAEKIKEAKTALDRTETIIERASEDIKKMMKDAKAENRQAQTAGIGKVFLHLDFSGSMSSVQQFASDRGTILAECVNDPANNFAWGAFGSMGVRFPLPKEFVKDAFQSILFGQVGLGGTDCFALYDDARKFGADIDIFVSDQEHTHGNLAARIKEYHERNPLVPKPRACVIVNFGSGKGLLANAYEANGIPVSLIRPDALTESALVIEAVKTAMLGPVAIVDDIMNTELLKLPDYYYSL